MNEQQHYLKAIETLGAKIAELETDLMIKDFELKDLKKKLEDAERAWEENGKN